MEEFARLEQAIVMELESLTDLRNSETARASQRDVDPEDHGGEFLAATTTPLAVNEERGQKTPPLPSNTETAEQSG